MVCNNSMLFTWSLPESSYVQSLALSFPVPDTPFPILLHLLPFLSTENFFQKHLITPFFPDHFKEVELDALHSSVDALSARLRRHLQASKANHQQQKTPGKKSCAGDDQMSMLKSSLEKLSLVNTENSKKVKLVESTLRNKERSSRESSLPIL